jgi:hypothetical protein
MQRFPLIADAVGTPKSQCVPMVGYFIVMVYSLDSEDAVEKTRSREKRSMNQSV